MCVVCDIYRTIATGKDKICNPVVFCINNNIMISTIAFAIINQGYQMFTVAAIVTTNTANNAIKTSQGGLLADKFR